MKYNIAWLLLAPGCFAGKGDDLSTTDVASTSTIAEATGTASAVTEVDSNTTALVTTTDASSWSSSWSWSSGSSSTGDAPLPTPDAMFCPLDWTGSTTITGTAPAGMFDGSVAWFEWQLCNGFYPMVVVVEDGLAVQDWLEEGTPIARAVAFSLPTSGWEDLALTGMFQPTVYEMVAGEWTAMNLSQAQADVSASVSVTETQSPTGVPRIVGEFSIISKKGGTGVWDLAGSFDAAYCGRLNDFKSINCD